MDFLYQIINTLTKWVMDNPESVVAYGLGIVTVALVYWLVRRPLLGKLEQVRNENYELCMAKGTIEVKFQEAKIENENLRSTQQALSEEASQLRQANAKLEATVEALTGQNQELRSTGQASAQENIELREAKARLETKLERTSEESNEIRQTCQRLTGQNDELHRGNVTLQSALEKALAERESLQNRVVALSEALETSKESEGDLEQQVSELTEQVQRLADFDGKVWERPPTAAVPEFRPLRGRQAPVIAVANVKGGVGKTTLTANLGAILAKQGERVLLVDLDYQGSLTSLCLAPGEIREIRRRGEFVDQLFRKLDVQAEELAPYSHCVSQLAEARLIAADEPLADVENQVMARWLLNPDHGDVRYILRSYLHSDAVQQQYDYVLIDCPPRLTTACINAFTAADFLLIPVLLDRTSAEAVPRQLQWLRRVKRVACPDLALLGVVANRVFPRASLIQRENDVWDSLSATCEGRWGEPIRRFSTVIRQHAAFAESARANGFAALHRDIQPIFLDLAKELKDRIAEHERQGCPAVSSQPGTTT